ncbi:MAG: hypothetical protein EXR72_17755 [Myxococcales bacterium]|nr:hypothetical protein [Myxococcales bacterium]
MPAPHEVRVRESAEVALPPATDSSWARAAALIVALPLMVYAPVLFFGKTFILRDHAMYVVPSRWHLARALASGQLPEWWSAVGLGAPFAANPAHCVFYPPAWLAGVLPVAFGADLLLLLHIAWGGLGLMLLSRRLGARPLGAVVAAASFMLSGYFSGVLPQCLAPLTLAWTPWIGWGADRLAAASTSREALRRGLELAALFAAAILSGDPAGILDAGLVAGMVLLARAPTWRTGARGLAIVAGAAAAAVALAALLVVPSLHLLGDSERASGVNLAAAEEFSMHPLRLLEMFWPGLLGDPFEPAANVLAALDPNPAGVWAYSLHLGAGVVALAWFGAAKGARDRRILLASAAVLLLLAMGKYTPVHALYYNLVPIARLVRFPEKHAAGAIVLLAALAGAGFSTVCAAAPSRRLVA